MSKVFLASVENNNLHFSEGTLARLHDDMKAHPKAMYRVTRDEVKRSMSQHRYYFLFLQVISQETGEEVDDLHQFFKRKLLQPKYITVMGEEIKLPRSTKELTKNEMGEYLDRISALVEIPLPDITKAGYTPMNER